MFWTHRIVWSASVALVAGAAWAQYEPLLQYQRRGSREEGLRTVAVGGQDIELVSARIDGARLGPRISGSARWSGTVKARFFLPDQGSAYLAIRQLRSQAAYYWLNFPARDQLELAQTWTPKQTNEYTWPTSVLARIEDVQLDDLGAVVRLGVPTAGNIQQVLPVALFDQEVIESVEAYRFSFRPLKKANISAVIFRDSTEVMQRAPRWEDADSPFTVLWSPANAPEGWYRLVLSGFFENNAPLSREVRFYHHKSLRNPVELKVR